MGGGAGEAAGCAFPRTGETVRTRRSAPWLSERPRPASVGWWRSGLVAAVNTVSHLSPTRPRPGGTRFAVEHIIPRARGGSHRPANLAFSCLGCNSYKQAEIAAVDAVSGERVPLY